MRKGKWLCVRHEEKRGRWRYDFSVNKVRYTGTAKTEKECVERGKARRMKVELGLRSIVKQIPGTDFGVSLEDLQAKYRMIYEDPKFTLPDIVDMVMADLQIPYSFRDINKIIRSTGAQRQIPAQLRAEVLNRDNFTCQWCGAKAPDVVLHIDHIIPVIRGGKTESRNLQTLCHACNIGKSDKVFHLLPPEGQKAKSIA
jgi:hypothetical protein